MKSIDIEESRSFPKKWVGLIWSVEGLKKKGRAPQGRRNSDSRLPSTQVATGTVPWDFSLITCPAGCGLGILHNRVSPFLNILSLPLSISHSSHTYTHACVYVLCVSCFSGECWLMQSWERVLPSWETSWL